MSAMKGKELEPTAESSKEVDLDAALLAALGYKQGRCDSPAMHWNGCIRVELRRDFSPLQIFGLAFSIVGLVSSFSSVLIFSIPYGGMS
ncbi:gaba permease [Moniliophthora roreri]|nr:gaba permease [Moniliophthora roreri]